VLEERYDTEGFDYAPILHCGDHEPFILESPQKAQGLAMEDIVEHIPCGPARKELYASMDWVERYMKDMGMISDTSLGDIIRVMDTVAPKGYRMVQDDSVIGNTVCRAIHWHTVVYSGVLECFLLGYLLIESSRIPLS
jgi:hypothetical protein